MHMHDKPASFHRSPKDAMQAPAEEFLYLACLHEGTGVERPDFLAVVDAERGEIVYELPMPNVGDELHHFGWNRCSSACHGPDPPRSESRFGRRSDGYDVRRETGEITDPRRYERGSTTLVTTQRCLPILRSRTNSSCS
jgi:hypothetical protein